MNPQFFEDSNNNISWFKTIVNELLDLIKQNFFDIQQKFHGISDKIEVLITLLCRYAKIDNSMNFLD